MTDPYLYEDVPVLRNKLEIRDERTLDMIEAEVSRQNMMLLYEQGFEDFTPEGLCKIHAALFGDLYEWAGKYRIINIEKREQILGGRSVWYANDEDISRELSAAFRKIHLLCWKDMTKETFVSSLAQYFPKLWKIHPFREGNTRTVVMMMTFFVEHCGYSMDQELMAASAGYVRDSFVMASLDRYAEYQHLETILADAISDQPIEYDPATLDVQVSDEAQSEKYRKYQREPYKPQPHYRREE